MILKIGVIGLGYIGTQIIDYITKSDEKYILEAVFDVDNQRLEEVLEMFPKARKMTSITDFNDCDVVIEAAVQDVVINVFDEVVKKEKYFIPMSVGAFITNNELYSKFNDLSQNKKKRILLPSGAIGGFDAIKAINSIGIESSKLVTNKPLKVFANHTYVREQEIKLSNSESTLVFQGNAKGAASVFPRSINVGARLALATLGPEKTMVEVYANPNIEKNIHEIEIVSEVGNYKFSFQNNPAPTNPKTSWLAALSAIELLENL